MLVSSLRYALLLLLGLAVLAPPRVSGQALALPRPTLAATRTATPPRIDGDLDDAVWAQAPVVSDFTQRQPDVGRPASQRTEVRLLYDEGALYVAARMFDTAPDSIGASLFRRDEDSYSDWFIVMVDSYHDRRTAFFFEVSPRGVKSDRL
ncbi:MAG TPA: carbohydrate binding family 9 domain-containing protein, partial [Rhodothermales bacterium]|nr:carbohydrate binding family 9 domain-containing protein [Rhodothermales bacterium]